MSDTEPIKITLEDLETDKPLTAEKPRTDVRDQAEQIGRQVTGAVKDTAGKATRKVAAGVGEVAGRSADAARDKVAGAMEEQARATAKAVEDRVREIDWKGEAQKGATTGLKWLSQQLADLADRLGKAEPKKTEQPPEQQ